MKRPPFGRLALAVFLFATSGTALADGSLAPLAELQTHGARVSALIVRLDNGKEIAAIGPDTPLAPASVSKLYVTAAALNRWGPSYQFRTRLLATGSIHHGVIEGDLIFMGAGDPGLGNTELWQLAHNLAEQGIYRVTGDLIVNASYFGPLNQCITEDRCNAVKESGHAYDALLSSAAVNFSSVEINVMPGSYPGAATRVTVEPFPLPMFELHNRIKTGKAHTPWKISVTRVTQDNHDILTVSGTVPAEGGAQSFSRSVGDPNRYAGEVLNAFLAQAGVTISGKIRVESFATAAGTEVAYVDGQRLWMLLRSMLTWSNNYMADTLALDLLRTRQRPPLSLTAAGAQLSTEGSQLESHSTVMHGYRPKVQLLSGSGLTPASRVSARDVVALLDALYHDYGLLPTFVGSLTVPEYTPTHMLKAAYNPAWMQRIAAKTGSLSEPHSVFALAGYMRLSDGSWGAFAVLVNGVYRHDVPLWIALSATRDALTSYLMAHPSKSIKHH